MNRIAVVGCSGSGKSTFCRQIAKKIGLPLIHLDYSFHDSTKDYVHDKEAWYKKAKELIDQPTWIIDGVYSSTFSIRFKRADVIFFFDYPRYICLYRIFKRWFEYRKKHREDMPLDWQEKIDWGFLRFVWTFNKAYRYKITDELAKADKKVIVFHNPKETELYLKKLSKV